MRDIKSYGIGDELFRFIEGGGFFRYIVTGRRENQDGVQLEVECQACSHGFKCSLLIGQDDYGRIFHIHMLNEDEDGRERMWHRNDGEHFFEQTLEAAKSNRLKVMIRRREKAVRDAEAALAYARKSLDELKALADEVQP